MVRMLVFDPSGNKSKRDGNGTSGWAYFVDGVLQDFGSIRSEEFDIIEDYWLEHRLMLVSKRPDIVICESYKLQAGKAMQQSWSNLETPQLIGYMRMACYSDEIEFVFQDPKDKARMNDEILVHKGVAEKRGQYYYIQGRRTNLHERDSIRHGLFYLKYGQKS